ncbi:hypothetical protein A3K55_01250 [Candidatus Shapirobacteria bacterium RBG_13_44_7]|uniref:Uncharacterized protein n=1 Tax=Candidatus Shapirobacteria bacterium RBG_13_44_7 TaxID=1802149 RepID=A0A1F7SKD6_9BACT|nr:MAG: hypothetical protein A3K55_01250 [Candidatus Shapirobacteria bacterium RBG_13_44_7]
MRFLKGSETLGLIRDDLVTGQHRTFDKVAGQLRARGVNVGKANVVQVDVVARGQWGAIRERLDFTRFEDGGGHVRELSYWRVNGEGAPVSGASTLRTGPGRTGEIFGSQLGSVDGRDRRVTLEGVVRDVDGILRRVRSGSCQIV